VTELEEFVARLVGKLDAAKIAYMLVGSLASSVHGKPRSTRDVDVVSRPANEQALDELIKRFPSEDYYVSDDAAHEAFRHHTQFNVIEMSSMWKADLIIPEANAFQDSEFARRIEVPFAGVRLCVASAEDSILAKLDWARQSESDRQLQDVADIVAVKGEALDLAYIERWVRALSLEALWSRVAPK
jgi:hypothetical protein